MSGPPSAAYNSGVSDNGVIPSIAETGAGPALLLLHGGPGLNDYMGMLGTEVDGWRAIRYQQRGLSPSATSGPFSVEQHVADLLSVLDAAGVERAVLLGHSWGGHLALHAVIAAPDRVAALVLVDPLGSTGDGGAAAQAAELVARLLPRARAKFAELAERASGPGASAADVTELLALQWPGYFADPTAAPPLPADFRVSPECNAQTMATVFGPIEDGSFAASLATVGAPVQIVLGERSPLPLGAGRGTASLLPQAELTVEPGAGHLPWVERPGCVAAALSRVRKALA